MGGVWWLILSALTIIPMIKLLPFFGINKYWAALCLIPFGTIAFCCGGSGCGCKSWRSADGRGFVSI